MCFVINSPLLTDQFPDFRTFSLDVLFVFKVMCIDLVNGLWFGLPCCKDMLHFLLS